MKRQLYGSGTDWEPKVGYSRAVRDGRFVYVSGTTPFDHDGRIVGVGDPYTQAGKCLENIEKALHQAGARMEDVVRTRMYVVDISDWEKIGRAHAEYFRDIKPAATMVEVKRLIRPEILVEIEADALIRED